MKKVTEQAIERILSQGVRDMPQNPASQGFSERQIRAFYYIPEQEILKLLSQVEDAFGDEVGELKFVEGGWNSETEYKKFNVVKYDEVLYVARKDSKGMQPSNNEYWIEVFNPSNALWIAKGEGEYSVKQTRPPDRTQNRAYQNGTSAFGGASEAGLSIEEFNEKWATEEQKALEGYDRTQLNGGLNIEIVDSLGDTYDKSYSFACAVGEASKSKARACFTSGAGNENYAPYSNVGGYHHILTPEGSASTVGGKQNYVSHKDCGVFGNHLKTGKAFQLLGGKYNEGKKDTLLEVGNGADEENRLNVFEVTENGVARGVGEPKNETDYVRVKELNAVKENFENACVPKVSYNLGASGTVSATSQSKLHEAILAHEAILINRSGYGGRELKQYHYQGLRRLPDSDEEIVIYANVFYRSSGNEFCKRIYEFNTTTFAYKMTTINIEEPSASSGTTTSGWYKHTLTFKIVGSNGDTPTVQGVLIDKRSTKYAVKSGASQVGFSSPVIVGEKSPEYNAFGQIIDMLRDDGTLYFYGFINNITQLMSGRVTLVSDVVEAM